MAHAGPNEGKKRKREEEEVSSNVPKGALDEMKSAFASIVEEIEESSLSSYKENPQKELLDEAINMMKYIDFPIEEIKDFLKVNSINLRAKNLWGEPPLVSVIGALAASYIGRLKEVVSLLLQCGASAQDQDQFGNTPLHVLMLVALKTDKDTATEIALLLYQNKGSFYVKNRDGKTPIVLILESFATSEDIQEVLGFTQHLPLPDNAKVTAETIKTQMQQLLTKKQKRLTPAFDKGQKEGGDNNQNPDPDNNNNSHQMDFSF